MPVRMHLLVRDHRIWILPALLVAVFRVPRAECQDDFFRTYFKDKKAGFVRTDGKTYHMQYEIDLDDALQQGQRFLKGISGPVVSVGTEFSTEENVQETTVATEANWDVDISREHPRAGDDDDEEEVLGVTEEGYVDESVEEKMEKTVKVGKYKPKFFKKKLKKKLRCQECICTDYEPSAEAADTSISGDEDVGQAISTTQPSTGNFDSEETDNTTDATQSPSEDDTVGRPRSPLKNLKKKLRKPFVVSVLKNFKLMFNLPIKLNGFDGKKTAGKKPKGEDDYDEGLVT